MRSLSIVFIAAALTVLLRPGAHAQSTLEKSQRDEIALVPDNDPDMATAFRKARETLDGFLAKVRDPHPSITAYAVKIPVSDGGQREFFWISRFEQRGGRLIGRIDNTPRLVHNIKQGERITFKPSDVVDWLYLENGKMVGNFTACVIIKRDTPQDAEAFKRHYGLTCEP
jgi:uncharacterized protein YegJ (DUF2314 family)